MTATPATATLFDPAQATYVSLATYRRNGQAVRTPVWIAGSAPHFYVFSAPSGKTKRIRANPQVALAHCDARGGSLGQWVTARAQLVTDPATVAAGYAALRRKYGWQMWLIDLFSKISGRYHLRILIDINWEPASP